MLYSDNQQLVRDLDSKGLRWYKRHKCEYNHQSVEMTVTVRNSLEKKGASDPMRVVRIFIIRECVVLIDLGITAR